MMKKFGFTINAKRAIDLDINDRSIARQVAARVPSWSLCIGCGGCSATCTAGALTDYNFRKLHLLARRGETSALRKQLNNCMLCGKCTLQCPRGVNTRGVIAALMELLPGE
ncbi:MAG: 4Fe-4S dicluster domain-containing protein [Rikenellaceae bacterium]|nr:4Fe-4S dicluster domain-containing protein [Rikenellaceae bacterium]MDE7355275.1 4Fe-4S dicluster domain-containing protein [Rikenellaceae bacterium]